MRFLIFCLIALVTSTQALAGNVAPIVLATTTSTENSGLLDTILPPFSQRPGITVKVVAVAPDVAVTFA